MGEPEQNGVNMTPTNMAVKAVYNALQSNQAIARFFIALFLLYPFVDNIYAKVQDAGLVPSIEQENAIKVEETMRILQEHRDTTKIQNDRSLRLELAKCINAVVTGLGTDKELQMKGIGLCVSSLEANYPEQGKLTLPLEMSRLINGLLREN